MFKLNLPFVCDEDTTNKIKTQMDVYIIVMLRLCLIVQGCRRQLSKSRRALVLRGRS